MVALEVTIFFAIFGMVAAIAGTYLPGFLRRRNERMLTQLALAQHATSLIADDLEDPVLVAEPARAAKSPKPPKPPKAAKPPKEPKKPKEPADRKKPLWSFRAAEKNAAIKTSQSAQAQERNEPTMHPPGTARAPESTPPVGPTAPAAAAKPKGGFFSSLGASFSALMSKPVNLPKVATPPKAPDVPNTFDRMPTLEESIAEWPADHAPPPPTASVAASPSTAPPFEQAHLSSNSAVPPPGYPASADDGDEEIRALRAILDFEMEPEAVHVADPFAPDALRSEEPPDHVVPPEPVRFSLEPNETHEPFTQDSVEHHASDESAHTTRDALAVDSLDWDSSSGAIALEVNDDGYTSWAPPISDENDLSYAASASMKAEGALTQADINELYAPEHNQSSLDIPVPTPMPVPTVAAEFTPIEEPVIREPEIAPPTWTLEFIDVLVPDAQKRVDLVDSIVALSDGLEKDQFLKIYLEIYRQDPAVRMAMISAVSDFGSELAQPILAHALDDENTEIVTEAFNRLVLRGEYELAAGALRNVDVAPIAMISLQEHLPDIEQRLERALSEDDVRKVREQMSFA